MVDSVPVRVELYGAAVRDPLSFDDVERLEFWARTPRAHREAAAILLSWAEVEHPDDEEVTRAALISAAAWHLDRAGDTEQGLELHRRAVTEPGTTDPDARCLLHAALLTAGRADEAKQVADDVRRSTPSLQVCALMAENFELVGDLKQAHRWLAIGVNRLDLGDDDELGYDWETAYLLRARRRVRHALGYPPDELDEAADETLGQDDEPV